MIRLDYNKNQEKLGVYSENFDGYGAENTAKIVSDVLERKK